MNTKNIEQTVTFEASAQDVFDALMNEAKHAAFTGAPATVGQNAGDAFSCHDGCVEGRLIESVAGERIVQAWRASAFPAGVYSLATYRLEALSPERTRLVFTHVGIPETAADMIEMGWHENYWVPLAKFLSRTEAKAA